MSEQLDRIEACVTKQGEQINRITQVLGGNKGLSQKGMVEDYHETKTQVYKTKGEVSKLKWFASLIATGVSALITGITTFFKS